MAGQWYGMERDIPLSNGGMVCGGALRAPPQRKWIFKRKWCILQIATAMQIVKLQNCASSSIVRTSDFLRVSTCILSVTHDTPVLYTT